MPVFTRTAATSALAPATKTGTMHNAHHARERRYLPLVINGIERYALPDTGLTENAITEDYAMSIGAVIKPASLKHSFVNARSQPFESVGVTNLVVSLPESSSKNPEVRKWTCSFAVVKELAAPLVMGSHFLRMTGALTSLAHLLVKKSMSVFHDPLLELKKVWRFMHMNLPTQELACYLDDNIVFAALDSGSDIDVVSLDYARSRKWRIRPLPDDEGYVLLANNELVKLKGYVKTAFEIPGRRPRTKRFYVLDGLMCDAVLGDPTLEALDVFNTAGSSIIESSTSEDMNAFHMIQWVEKIDEIGQDAERILSDASAKMTSSERKKKWKFNFRTSPEKRSLANDRGMFLCD